MEVLVGFVFTLSPYKICGQIRSPWKSLHWGQYWWRDLKPYTRISRRTRLEDVLSGMSVEAFCCSQRSCSVD